MPRRLGDLRNPPRERAANCEACVLPVLEPGRGAQLKPLPGRPDHGGRGRQHERLPTAPPPQVARVEAVPRGRGSDRVPHQACRQLPVEWQVGPLLQQRPRQGGRLARLVILDQHRPPPVEGLEEGELGVDVPGRLVLNHAELQHRPVKGEILRAAHSAASVMGGETRPTRLKPLLEPSGRRASDTGDTGETAARGDRRPAARRKPRLRARVGPGARPSPPARARELGRPPEPRPAPLSAGRGRSAGARRARRFGLPGNTRVVGVMGPVLLCWGHRPRGPTAAALLGVSRVEAGRFAPSAGRRRKSASRLATWAAPAPDAPRASPRAERPVRH